MQFYVISWQVLGRYAVPKHEAEAGEAREMMLVAAHPITGRTHQIRPQAGSPVTCQPRSPLRLPWASSSRRPHVWEVGGRSSNIK